MALRLESTSAGPMGSGFLPVQEGSQPSTPVGVTRHAQLPGRYGVSLLELLAVDPHFIFISWEITPAQLDEARQQFGADYDTRRLRIILLNARSGEQLAARELYGEIGRWFIQLNQPGVWLKADLQFVAGTSTFVLNTAGPLAVPRDAPVEPERWEELFVAYGRSEKGELRIESIERDEPGWPRIAIGGVAEVTCRLGDSAELTSFGTRRSVDAGLLRPLLPLAPASVEERDD